MIDDPWYFEPNGITSIPDDMLGQGIVIQIIDTCVDFDNNPSLLHCHLSSDEDKKCKENLDSIKIIKDTTWKDYIHGTTIASLICAKEGVHDFHKDDPSKSYYIDKGINKVHVKGIAPYAKIQAFEYPIKPLKVETVINDAQSSRAEKTNTGTELFPDFKQTNMIIVNLSGGQKNKDADMEGWRQIISNACKDKYTLIISAAGNDGCNLNKQNTCKVQPSAFKTQKVCGEIDTLLSVGALNKYNTQEKNIKLYSSSNYGDKYLNILAPGQLIPSLAPKDFGTIASGTSQATAIVSGLAAILVNCDANANANEILNAILEGADKYENFIHYAKDGKILNMHESVKRFCLNNDTPQTLKKENASNNNYLLLTISVILISAVIFRRHNIA
jgi:subtilase cytotoxin subunit A